MQMLNMQQTKLVDLSKVMAKAGVKAITHVKGSQEWWAWHAWRKRNGLGVAFMESRNRFGFPCDMPPDGSLDTALDEAMAGTAGKKRMA